MRRLVIQIFLQMATSENPKIKACDRTESRVYTKVNEHFGEGSNIEFWAFGGC